MTYEEYLKKYFPNTEFSSEASNDIEPFSLGMLYVRESIEIVINKLDSKSDIYETIRDLKITQ